MLNALFLLFSWPTGQCFFVDQAEAGRALIRHDDGSTEMRNTTLPEGTSVCEGRRREPPALRLPHRPLAAGLLTLDDLQE